MSAEIISLYTPQKIPITIPLFRVPGGAPHTYLEETPRTKLMVVMTGLNRYRMQYALEVRKGYSKKSGTLNDILCCRCAAYVRLMNVLTGCQKRFDALVESGARFPPRKVILRTLRLAERWCIRIGKPHNIKLYQLGADVPQNDGVFFL